MLFDRAQEMRLRVLWAQMFFGQPDLDLINLALSPTLAKVMYVIFSLIVPVISASVLPRVCSTSTTARHSCVIAILLHAQPLLHRLHHMQ